MLQPTDEQELVACLAGGRDAYEIIGGGAKRGVGGIVDARPLCVAAISGVVDYAPEELIVTARAATPLDELTRLLASAGQRFAFDPATLPGAAHAAQTIGGVLGANLAGSRRVTAGAARDHFLGFRAVNGRGVAFKAGGKVVKNVTGYDLPKLLAGSWGTLAVLTEVTLRAVPVAEHECTLVLGVRDVEAAIATMTRALGSTHDVSSAAFDPASGRVLLRLEGFGPSVGARLATLRAEQGIETYSGEAGILEGDASRDCWRDMGAAASLADAPILWRLSVPPSDAARVVRALTPERYLLDWGGGLIWLAASAVDTARIRAAVREGHATLIKAPIELRATCEVFPPLPPTLAALTARVKAAFDPLNRLNPGRMG